jgi:hypothetical protein
MTTEELTCRVYVNMSHSNDEDVSLARVCVKDYPKTAIETRLLWARDIGKEFQSYSKLYDTIRL